MISVCMCISEHTVKTIVQGMRKKIPPTCKKSPPHAMCEAIQTRVHMVRVTYMCFRKGEAAGFKNPKRMQKERAGFKNPKRLQPSHEQVWLTMD